MLSQSLAACQASSGLRDASKTVSSCSLAAALDLSASGKVLAEYIWVAAGSAGALESRTIVLDSAPASAADCPVAEVDGSHSLMATSDQCELFLRPCKVFPDPMRGGPHVLVLCDVFVPPQFTGFEAAPKLEPHPSNTRVACEQVMAKAAEQAPLIAAQQEYCVMDTGAAGISSGMGFPGAAPGGGGLPGIWTHPHGQPGCMGARPAAGRALSELHMHACIRAGISISGAQQLSADGSWCYKLGPLDGLELGDQLWVSRHLLRRIAEQCGATVSLEPGIPCSPGASCHSHASSCFLEFSTKASRSPEAGISAVQQHVMRLQAHHADHCSAYSPSSPSLMQLLAGSPEAHACLRRYNGSLNSGASQPSAFTCGVGSKHVSVMIPSSTLLNRCGPIVDRRPPANMDPYLSTSLLVAAALDLPLPDACLRSVQHGGVRSGGVSFSGLTGGLSASQRGATSLPATGSLSSDGPSGSYSDASGGNSEELLISELYRRDAAGEGGCPAGGLAAADMEEGVGETCSDGESPLTLSPLAGTCRDDDMAEFYE